MASASKILTLQDLAPLRQQLAAKGERLVFTNGCFDLLHVGHVRYLQQARALGERLIVALNGDESVRALKGPSRPINGEADRAEILAALACVDYVIVFHEKRVSALLEAARPAIYAKGGDYTRDSLDPGERATLDTIGADIRILPLVPGRSTTAIVNALS